MSKQNPKILILVYDSCSVHYAADGSATYENPVDWRCADSEDEYQEVTKELCEWPDSHVVLLLHGGESGTKTITTIGALRDLLVLMGNWNSNTKIPKHKGKYECHRKSQQTARSMGENVGTSSEVPAEIH